MTTADSADVPLCIDLDGTLLSTDTFQEACVQLLKRHPLRFLQLPFWFLFGGKAYAKQQTYRFITQDIESLPAQTAFLEFLKQEHAKGRKLILVTASDHSIADQVAARFGFFSDVMASRGNVNLKGSRKAQALIERFGKGKFDYAGNALVDVAVWKAAHKAIVVQASAGVLALARKHATVERVFARPNSIARAFWRAVRPHQAFKNILIFVPLLSSHTFTDPSVVQRFVLAFLAFTACTSAVYLLNDLFDVENDRAHPHKRNRPIARGDLPVSHAILAIVALLTLGISIASTLPQLFFFVLLVYMCATTLYSAFLKQVAIADVLMLAMLYMLRIVAGNAASGISFSFWLLIFSVFFFFSLGNLKRYSELLMLGAEGKQSVAGRGYLVSDAPLVQSLGIGAGMVSILILGLYVDTQRVTLLYTYPYVLWFECVLMLYWLSRIWMLGHRRQLKDDPILFTVRDPHSYVLGVLVALVAFLAA